MKMPSNIQDLYTRYYETNEEAKRLESDLKEMKNAIIEHLGGQRSIVECGYSVKLTPGVRKTLNKVLTESVLGVSVTDECFKHTMYDSLSVTPTKA